MRAILGVLALVIVAVGLAQEKPTDLSKKPMYERLLTGDDAKKAAELQKSVTKAIHAEDWTEAAKQAQSLIDFRTEKQGADHYEVTDARQLLARVSIEKRLTPEERKQLDEVNERKMLLVLLLQEGDKKRAVPLAEQVLATENKLLGENHPSYSLNLNNLGTLYLGMDVVKTTEARLLLQKALEIRRTILGDDHPDTSQTYSILGQSIFLQGNEAEAGALLQKALDIRRKILGEDHDETVESYHNFALYLSSQGKVAEAGAFLQKVLDIRRKILGEKHRVTAQSHRTLGNHLWAQGKLAEAEPLFQKAAEILAHLYEENHPEMVTAYIGLAEIFDEKGKAAEAELMYQKALDINRKAFGEYHWRSALIYNNLAARLGASAKAAEAEPLYRKALEIRLKVLGEGHPNTARSYNNLAYNSYAQGKVAEAVTILHRTILNVEIGRLNRAQGIDRAAGERISNPRLLLAAIDQSKSPAEAWSQVELSLARGFLDQQGTPALTPAERVEQARLRDRSTDLQSQLLGLVSKPKRTDAESAKLEKLLRDRQEVSEKLSALAVAESQRAVAGREQIQGALSAKAALLTWVDVFSDGVEEHYACVVTSSGEPFWVALPGTGEKGKWTKDDSALPFKFSEALAQPVPPSNFADLTAALRKQRIEPVLDHLKKHGVTQLFVVGVNWMAGIPVEVIAPEFTVSYVPSGTYLARLPKKPKYDNTLLAVGDPIYELKKAKPKELTALPPHGLLIDALAPGGSAAKLGIKPGQVLLQYGDTKLTTLDDLKAAVQKAAGAGAKMANVTLWSVDDADKASETVVKFPVGPLGVILAPDPAPLAVGNRRKTEAVFAKLRSGEEWKDLPGTRYEVNRLRELFPNATVLVDDKASEAGLDALRRSGDLGKFRYLHFATHGKGNNVTAFESKLILSQNQTKDEFSKPGEPWLNNEVSAREVLDHWKLNADLVTLSACQTGLGKQGSGDGLLGFAQAFLLSGSRSVCLSLWEVDDTATALLMQRFYQNLLGQRDGLKAPLPKAKALEEAKQWLRKLTAKEATALTATLTGGVARSRGPMTFKTPEPTIPADTAAGDEYKPFARPHYWSAFILLGEPE